MGSLLDKIEDGLREGCISDGPSYCVLVVLQTSLRVLTGGDLFRHVVVLVAKGSLPGGWLALCAPYEMMLMRVLCKCYVFVVGCRE